jgi:hypothetical protein
LGWTQSVRCAAHAVDDALHDKGAVVLVLRLTGGERLAAGAAGRMDVHSGDQHVGRWNRDLLFDQASRLHALAHVRAQQVEDHQVAWLFVRNEPHDRIILSLHAHDPLNWTWSRFIRENHATVVYDDWLKGPKEIQYSHWAQRRSTRLVSSIPFDTYKQLYPRLDGGDRQGFLCGTERGLGRRNIFEYYYFGQETHVELLLGSTSFGTYLIEVPRIPRKTDRCVFVAPHEKCQGNRVFTHAFWRELVHALLAVDIAVVLNDDGRFCREITSPLLSYDFAPLERIAETIASHRLILCGNTGIGRVVGAVGTPLIACENADAMAFGEYSFQKCGVESLRAVLAEPSVEQVMHAVLAELDRE